MKSSGFTKAERLKRSATIQSVFRKGKKYSCDGAKLFVLENGLEQNRIVFTFPRGYGTAVERNHSRRLSKEAYRIIKHDLMTGYDLTVLVYPGKDSFSVREKQLTTLFAKAGLRLKSS
ncbi:ribonuclease P protein component [Treponema zuelzerae]|uniref:Ribonuclease P protein component n=1 Tax=Teretinema zuelzerae TaxID=156 RepID=A0AAE3JJN0_9SPIR|nr:ribonuclease P protein component [Teretinema zuelzerae]MCD1654415.1 ribonuclease P protein component [Teretinema zuelzerae]HPO03234.1 ribonuclease P protein component [Treponemataceae bacterium]